MSQLGAKDLKEVGMERLFKDDADTVEALTGRLSVGRNRDKGQQHILEYCLQ